MFDPKLQKIARLSGVYEILFTFVLMILFADSGSTKTSWLLYDSGSHQRLYFETLGINPVVQARPEIDAIVRQDAELLASAEQVREIRFYGAGCSSPERIALVSGVLEAVYPNAKVFVDHDMKAAGVAVCGGQPGIACILGTGSNSILFDGQEWHDSQAGIGYVLGDEGSGAYLGKFLLRDFIYGRLPEDLYRHLKEQYGLSKDIILENVYKRPSPNRYLAGFTPVLSAFRETDYSQELLHRAFTDFFIYGVKPFPNYQRYPVGFVGSVAKHFDTELLHVVDAFGCRPGKFVQRPIDEIAAYYTGQG